MRTAVVLALLAVTGSAAGVVAKAADESGHPWAGDLGSYPAAWVLAVAVIGWTAPGLRQAAVRSAVFFAAMSVAYYTWAAVVLGFGWNARLLLAWVLLSATAVPAVAVAVQAATRRSGPLPGALLAAAAGITLGGGAVAHAAGHPVQAVVDVGVAGVLTLLLPLSGRTRLAAVLLTLPLTWVAGRLLDLLQQLL